LLMRCLRCVSIDPRVAVGLRSSGCVAGGEARRWRRQRVELRGRGESALQWRSSHSGGGSVGGRPQCSTAIAWLAAALASARVHRPSPCPATLCLTCSLCVCLARFPSLSHRTALHCAARAAALARSIDRSHTAPHASSPLAIRSVRRHVVPTGEWVCVCVWPREPWCRAERRVGDTRARDTLLTLVPGCTVP
jgi:hypothetical protein